LEGVNLVRELSRLYQYPPEEKVGPFQVKPMKPSIEEKNIPAWLEAALEDFDPELADDAEADENSGTLGFV
jgi:hypothetical protein